MTLRRQDLPIPITFIMRAGPAPPSILVMCLHYHHTVAHLPSASVAPASDSSTWVGATVKSTDLATPRLRELMRG